MTQSRPAVYQMFGVWHSRLVCLFNSGAALCGETYTGRQQVQTVCKRCHDVTQNQTWRPWFQTHPNRWGRPPTRLGSILIKLESICNQQCKKKKQSKKKFSKMSQCFSSKKNNYPLKTRNRLQSARPKNKNCSNSKVANWNQVHPI